MPLAPASTGACKSVQAHADCAYRVVFLQSEAQTVAGFVQQFLGYEWSFRWWTILIMAGYSIFFFCTCLLALKKLNWQNR